MNQSNVRICNMLPSLSGEDEEAEAGVREGIGNRPGRWKASLSEPQDASYWEIRVTGPDGSEWDFKFSGLSEETRAFVSRTIDEAFLASG